MKETLVRNGEQWGGFREKGQWPSAHSQKVPSSVSWDKKQESAPGLGPRGPLPGPCIFTVSLTHLARFQAGRPEMEREKSHIESWKKYKFSGNTGNKNSAAGRGKLTKNQELIRAGPLWPPRSLIYLGTVSQLRMQALSSARSNRFLACEAFSALRALRLACFLLPSFLLKLLLCGCCVHSSEAFKQNSSPVQYQSQRDCVL